VINRSGGAGRPAAGANGSAVSDPAGDTEFKAPAIAVGIGRRGDARGRSLRLCGGRNNDSGAQQQQRWQKVSEFVPGHRTVLGCA